MTAESVGNKSALRSKRFAHRHRTGCLTCRIRRLKCDERKPLCGRCQKNGYECRGFGYADGLGRELVKKRLWHITTAQLSPISSIPSSPGYTAQFQASSNVRDILFLGKAAQVKEAEAFSSLARNTQAQCISLRVCLEFLPSMTGYDTALDSAVACVANALRCCFLSPLPERGISQKSSPSPAASPSSPTQVTLSREREQSLALYARALKDLQQGLNDPRRSVQTELLLATILLIYFEAIYGYTETGIIAHADGASKLIQYRGPHRFTSILEKKLLSSQIPLIVTSALFLNKSVFLNTPDWVASIKSTLEYSAAAEADGRIAMEYMIASMTSLDILAAITALATNTQLAPANRNKQRIALLRMLAHAQQDYDEWRRRLERDIDESEKEFRLFPANSLIPSNGYSDSEARINLWFWSEAGGFLLLRLHVALGGDNSHAVELKLQRLASEGMAFFKENGSRVRQQATLIFLMLASAVLATAEEWARFSADGKGKLVEMDMLFRWLARMGVQRRPL